MGIVILGQKLSRRMMSTNGWVVFCVQCGDYHPENEFRKRKDGPWGLNQSCKLHQRQRPSQRVPEMDHFKLSHVTEDDFKGAQNLLENMGYCFDCGKSVHQQFSEKYKLL